MDTFVNGEHEIPLAHGFEFIRSHIGLMALRLPDSTVPEVDMPDKNPRGSSIRNGFGGEQPLTHNQLEKWFGHWSGKPAKTT